MKHTTPGHFASEGGGPPASDRAQPSDNAAESAQARRGTDTPPGHVLAERTGWDILQYGQGEVLKLLATGRPLADVLEALVRTLEAHSDGMLGSVLLLDREHGTLHHGAAPNLPEGYNQAIDGVGIGPAVGSCGTAAHRGERVVVDDIDRDPLWEPYRELARGHGLAASWSEPIKALDGAVLGTFAMYYGVPRGPTEEDLRVIEWAANLAGIAIERFQMEEAQRREQEILEQRVLERTAQLEQAQALARKQGEELAHVLRVTTMGEIVAELAHELNQPLEAIVNYAGASSRLLDAGSHGKVVENIQRIAEQAERADAIIRRLRAMVRRGPSERQSQDINEVIAGVAPLIEADCRRHEVPLCLELTEGLPAVLADEVRLQQALLNLTRNALEAMAAEGAGALSLCIRTRLADDGGVEVAVQDSGPGLSPEVAEHLFESFFTTRAEGLGLGLSITRTIVEAHGGRVWALNDDGGGATFRFVLPVPPPGTRS